VNSTFINPVLRRQVILCATSSTCPWSGFFQPISHPSRRKPDIVSTPPGRIVNLFRSIPYRS